ncbi:hypothetical protein TSAR_014356 [Trichomalopsis sarcophagae]|uniref:J domain-containing protein n=1 Tax=Trichomalopsis sarcophagae TaxID=543379 RepID=A0A232F121_9HYME|nr:hypothetical protein TSAR_014356 [Trichomalopsis sarcophagae]
MSGITDVSNKDLYKILDCTVDSSPEELKQAYHRKILESHPDKSTDPPKSTETFHDVKQAWKILGNPVLKKEYDIKCRQADLEAQGALIYARVSPAELEETEEGDILSYQCRCGNSYLVQKSDLEEKNCVIHVPCQDCTFSIAIET